MSLHSDSVHSDTGKKFQHKKIVVAEVVIINLGKISALNRMKDIDEPIEDKVEKEEEHERVSEEEEKCQVACRCMLQMLKNSDRIARRMLLHDIIHLTINKTQNTHVSMKA